MRNPELKSYVGMQIGALKVLYLTDVSSSTQGKLYMCKCSCGMFVARGTKQLTKNIADGNGSCGKGHMPRANSLAHRSEQELHRIIGYKPFKDTRELKQSMRPQVVKVDVKDVDLYVVHPVTPYAIAVYVNKQDAELAAQRMGSGYKVTRTAVQPGETLSYSLERPVAQYRPKDPHDFKTTHNT